MNKLRKVKVRELDSHEKQNLEYVMNRKRFHMNYLFSIMATVLLLTSLLRQLGSAQNRMTMLLFYGCILVICWLPSFYIMNRNRIRKNKITTGEVLGTRARCLNKVLVSSRQRGKYKYTFSTDMGETKTLRYYSQQGRTIKMNDIFYIIKVTRRDVFFVKLDR